MYSEILGEILVCLDCMIEHANGEISPDRPADLPEPWALLTFGHFATMGGEHNEECANFPEWQGEECECDNYGFSASQCEGCGDYLHGDRFKFTLWRNSIAETMRFHTVALSNARASADMATRHLHLAYAAQCREYIRDRYAADKREAA